MPPNHPPFTDQLTPIVSYYSNAGCVSVFHILCVNIHDPYRRFRNPTFQSAANLPARESDSRCQHTFCPHWLAETKKQSILPASLI